ncbi:MAG: ABC transporter permease [Thermoproteota archaeon]|jgi:predicted lysophospholipase L1 biosynthesis ABC-type transport system permease subunit|nr:ABC transporter permease [Thermoproteota archaeon]
MKYPVSKLFLISIILAFYLLLPLTSLILIESTYSSITSFVGENSSEILIYDRNARTPATSRLPASLFSKIASVNGVEAVSPEVIAIALIKNELVTVRGVDISLFSKIEKIEILYGRSLSLNDSFSMIVGYRLFERLGLKINESIVIKSIGTDEVLQLKLIGVFKADNSLDEEVLVPLHVGSTLAGLSWDYVSYFRVKVTNIDSNTLYEEIIKAQPSNIKENILIKFLIGSNINYTNLKIQSAPTSMEEFLTKEIRLTQYSLIGFVLIIIIMSFFILLNIIEYYSGELDSMKKIMKYIGANKNKILKYSLKGWILLFTFSIVISIIIIYIFSYIFDYISFINIFGHYLVIEFQPYFILSSLIFVFITSIVLLLYNEKK